jgi:hypothetical protein
VTYGVALIYWPAALIVGGLSLMAGGILGAQFIAQRKP